MSLPWWPEGIGFRHFGFVTSTMDEARTLALAGEAGPLWVLADMQSGGRGRRGRAWTSKRGNLHATLLFRPSCPPERFGELAFVAGLAVAETVAEYAKDMQVRIKWPNDVLLRGNKIAGILIEAGEAKDARFLLVGVGINLAGAPEKSATEFPAVALCETTRLPAPEPSVALAHLAERWSTWYVTWQIAGFEGVRARWLDRSFGMGQEARVRLADGSEIIGILEDIAEDGALLLRTGETVTRVAAGNVFFD